MTFPNAIQGDRGQPSKVRIGTFVNGVFVLQETVLDNVGLIGSGPVTEGDTVALLGQSAVGTSGSSWLALGRTVAPGAPSFRGMKLTVGADSIGAGAVEDVTWSAADWDTDGFWDAATPTLATIPFPGVYTFTFYLQFAAAALGLRYIEITQNATRVVAHRHPAIGADFAELTVATELACDAGDLIRFRAFQSTAGPLSTTEGSATIRLVGTLAS